jgi:hypothetical protein
MSDEAKYRELCMDMIGEWMTDHHVEMTMENREQIRDQEAAFDRAWTSIGGVIPPMKRTLAQIYYGV